MHVLNWSLTENLNVSIKSVHTAHNNVLSISYTNAHYSFSTQSAHNICGFQNAFVSVCTLCILCTAQARPKNNFRPVEDFLDCFVWFNTNQPLRFTSRHVCSLCGEITPLASSPCSWTSPNLFVYLDSHLLAL